MYPCAGLVTYDVGLRRQLQVNHVGRVCIILDRVVGGMVVYSVSSCDGCLQCFSHVPLRSIPPLDSIEKAKLFCFRPCPPRATNCKIDLKPSRNRNEVDESDTAKKRSTRFDRIRSIELKFDETRPFSTRGLHFVRTGTYMSCQ